MDNESLVLIAPGHAHLTPDVCISGHGCMTTLPKPVFKSNPASHDAICLEYAEGEGFLSMSGVSRIRESFLDVRGLIKRRGEQGNL